MESKQNYLVVGAGLSGSVIARELAEKGHRVDIIEKRNHIGGNCYDRVIDGVRVHMYGPHIFHTSNKKVVDWLSQFTDWVEYKHKVKALYNNQFLTIPPNIQTQDILGDKLFDVIYRPYTTKMWGQAISKEIIDRVKTRQDNNEYYFPDDTFQGLPKNGYVSMFNRILDHKNINVTLGVDFSRDLEDNYTHVFNSMPIDQYYDFKFGRLPYRSIKFHHLEQIDHAMPTAVVNYTDHSPYTRVTNWKLFPEHGNKNFYTKEEPCSYEENNYERYYPINDIDGKNKELYTLYKQIKNIKTTFIGRCGQYLYLNMDQAVSSSLSTVKKHA